MDVNRSGPARRRQPLPACLQLDWRGRAQAGAGEVDEGGQPQQALSARRPFRDPAADQLGGGFQLGSLGKPDPAGQGAARQGGKDGRRQHRLGLEAGGQDQGPGRGFRLGPWCRSRPVGQGPGQDHVLGAETVNRPPGLHPGLQGDGAEELRQAHAHLVGGQQDLAVHRRLAGLEPFDDQPQDKEDHAHAPGGLQTQASRLPTQTPASRPGLLPRLPQELAGHGQGAARSQDPGPQTLAEKGDQDLTAAQQQSGPHLPAPGHRQSRREQNDPPRPLEAGVGDSERPQGDPQGHQGQNRPGPAQPVGRLPTGQPRCQPGQQAERPGRPGVQGSQGQDQAGGQKPRQPTRSEHQ